MHEKDIFKPTAHFKFFLWKGKKKLLDFFLYFRKVMLGGRYESHGNNPSILKMLRIASKLDLPFLTPLMLSRHFDYYRQQDHQVILELLESYFWFNQVPPYELVLDSPCGGGGGVLFACFFPTPPPACLPKPHPLSTGIPPSCRLPPFAGCSITTQFLLLNMSLFILYLSWLFLVCTHWSFSGMRKESIWYGYRQTFCQPPSKQLSLFHECSLAVQDKGNIQQPRMPGHHWAEIIANQYPTSLGALIGFGGSAFQTRSVFCSFQLAAQDEGGITITEIVSFQ